MTVLSSTCICFGGCTPGSLFNQLIGIVTEVFCHQNKFCVGPNVLMMKLSVYLNFITSSGAVLVAACIIWHCKAAEISCMWLTCHRNVHSRVLSYFSRTFPSTADRFDRVHAGKTFQHMQNVIQCERLALDLCTSLSCTDAAPRDQGHGTLFLPFPHKSYVQIGCDTRTRRRSLFSV